MTTNEPSTSFRDPLTHAVIAVRQVEKTWGRPIAELLETTWERDEIKEQLVASLGCSERHLSRLLRVIQTPLPVQNAVRKRQLSIVSAEKVVDLPMETQAEIAKRIEIGESPKEVVNLVVGVASKRPKTAETSFRRYLKALNAASKNLCDSVGEIGFSPTADELSLLRDCTELNRQLIKKLKENAKANGTKRGTAVKQLKAILKQRNPG